MLLEHACRRVRARRHHPVEVGPECGPIALVDRPLEDPARLGIVHLDGVVIVDAEDVGHDLRQLQRDVPRWLELHVLVVRQVDRNGFRSGIAAPGIVNDVISVEVGVRPRHFPLVFIVHRQAALLLPLFWVPIVLAEPKFRWPRVAVPTAAVFAGVLLITAFERWAQGRGPVPVDDDVAVMMITNPNTLGLFEHQIVEIAVSAAEAALEAGVDELIICDTHHGGGNFLLDQVLSDPRITVLPRSVAYQGMERRWMPGLDETVDGFMVMGHHAKAGTKGAFLPHTQTLAWADFRINGMSVGEMGTEICYAGHWDVPPILAQGTELAVVLAATLLPLAATAAALKYRPALGFLGAVAAMTALVFAICMSEISASCIRAPPDAEKQISGTFSSRA